MLAHNACVQFQRLLANYPHRGGAFGRADDDLIADRARAAHFRANYGNELEGVQGGIIEAWISQELEARTPSVKRVKAPDGLADEVTDGNVHAP